MPYVPFALASVEAGYSGERAVNLFARQTPRGVAPVALLGRSGLERVAKITQPSDWDVPVRAMGSRGGTLFFAANRRLWSLTGTTLAELGDIDDGPTQMVVTGGHVALTVAGKFYLWDGSSITQPTVPTITSARGVAYIDGYHLLIGDGGGRTDAVAYSAIDDPTDWDGLDFFFAETNPDRLEAILVDHGEIWLFGARSIETWRNDGVAPFSRNSGGIQERGCLANTPAKEDNGVFWVGQDRVVYRSEGIAPEVISTREVDEALLSSTITGAFIHQDRGQKFYVIRREGASALVYDITTQQWCEFSTETPEGEWIGTAAHRIGAVQYVGTRYGAICTLGGYEDDRAAIPAQAVTAPIVQNGDWFRVSRLHLNVDNGGEDVDAEAMLSVSRDGKTWGQWRHRPLGALGEYNRRSVWFGLGVGRRMQFRLRITDPVSRDMMGVSYD